MHHKECKSITYMHFLWCILIVWRGKYNVFSPHYQIWGQKTIKSRRYCMNIGIFVKI